MYTNYLKNLIIKIVLKFGKDILFKILGIFKEVMLCIVEQTEIVPHQHFNS